MKKMQCVMNVVVILGITGIIYGQSITFHSPIPWTTLSDGKITTKTLIDTAEVKKKKVKLELYTIQNGKKRRLATKSFTPVDYSFETQLSELKYSVFGGTDFLRIEWSVTGTDNKGYIEPFGIIQLSEKAEGNQWKCNEITSNMKYSAIKSSLKDDDFISIGKVSCCFVWNNDKLGILCKNSKGVKNIYFLFDGKNGKNAFMSFPDRQLEYFPENDSLHAAYYKRAVTDSGIDYQSNAWIQEIKHEISEDIVLISIPWYDLGIIAKDERRFGFAVFVQNKDNKSIALPEKAHRKIPGTWGNLVLVKK